MNWRSTRLVFPFGCASEDARRTNNCRNRFVQRIDLDLAQIYIMLKDRKRATDTLERALKVDPWNDAARQQRLKVAGLPDENQ